MNVENSVIAGLQKRQPKPKPNRMGSETQRAQGSPNKKPIPLPSHLAPKQKQPIAQTQPEQPKSNKMLYVIGGVALLGVIGFLFLRKK
jgi:LPXTG-motif cell wall-anchored protein